MIVIKRQYWINFTPSASSSKSSNPVSNITDIKPMKTWEASTFDAAQWIVLDLGTARNVRYIFLNNCNFASATWQANSTDSWSSPAFQINITLNKDKSNNRKILHILNNSINYRYHRILIPIQTLDSKTTPFIGNCIIGNDRDILEYLSALNISLRHPAKKFETEFAFNLYYYGKARHIIDVSLQNSHQNINTYDLFSWDYAIISLNTGYNADCFLVYKPTEVHQKFDTLANCVLEASFEEVI